MNLQYQHDDASNLSACATVGLVYIHIPTARFICVKSYAINLTFLITGN